MRLILTCPNTTEVNQPITDGPIKGLGLMAFVGGWKKVLRKSAMVMAVAAGFIGSATMGWGATAYTMSSGNKTWDFADVANWGANFASGTDAANWGSVAINATGTLGDGIKTTVATTAFSTSSTGGVQKGSANIYLLSTSTTNSCAIDLYLNFSNRKAGTVSFDAATAFNSTGDRDSKLKLFYTTDGTTFTEITGTGLPYTARNNVAGSAAISVALPNALDNASSVRLRFYEYSTTGGAGVSNGSQPKISIDNVAVTSTAASPSITINSTTSATSADFTTTYGAASSNQTFTIAGTNLTANITATAGTGFQVSSDGGTYGSNATFTQSSGSASGTLYARLAANAAASGNYTSATVATLSSTSATNRTISTDSAGSAVSTRSLTITANDESKAFGNTVSSGSGKTAFSSLGLQNSEGVGSVTLTYAGGNNSSDLAGNYTITPSAATGGNFTASNYGISYGNGTLTVTAVAPSAPTITGVTAGNGQLSVAFTAPTSSGGASISNYKYSLNGGAYASAGTTSSPLVISSLNNGSEYTVTLKAVNSAGDGSASTGVAGTPVAPSSPTITVSGISGALATTYGTVSGERSFTVSGAALTGDLTVTAPTGVEVATTSGGSFGGSVVLTASSGSVSSTTVYARLKATASVTGSYNSVNFTVTGGGASQSNVATTSSGNGVTAKALTITGLTASPKVYDAGLTASVTGNATYSSLANSDSFTPSDVVTWAFADKGVGTAKVLSRTGSFSAPSSDYTVTQPSLTANITTRELTVTGATAQTKAYSGNATATITGAVLVGKQGADDVTIATSTGTFDTATAGTGKTVTAALTLGGADASNYTLVQPSNLSADITQASQSISGVTAAVTKLVGDVSYSVGGTASSGLALSYSSSVPSVASVDPSTGLVTVLSGGVTTITVSQAGNTNYSAALSVTQTLTVNQSLAAWDISATTMTATSCPTPTTAGNLTVTGFTRGSGITYNGTTYPREWGGYMGSITANATAAISSGTHLSLTVKANAGYKVSLSKIPAAKIYSNTAGPKKGQWQYSTGGNYTNVGSEMAWAVNGVNDAAEVDLSAVTDLQSVDSSKTITLRLLGYSNSATTGTFALYDDGTNSTAADISVLGLVATNPTISTTGSLAALSTTYGTATATPGNFSVSGLSMATGVTLTPPAGYELATTSNFTSTIGKSGSPLVVGASGTIASTPVYIRLSATATVAGSPYSGNVVLSSSGANSVNVATTSSTVSAKALTITGLTASNKDWDNTTNVTVTGTPTYSVLANSESFAVTGDVTWAFADALVGANKTLSRSGSYGVPSTNYSLTQPSLSASISAVVPVAPVISSITAGNGQLSVAFSAPSSNGGASVTNYEYSVNGGSNWTARSPANTSSPLVISSLNNGTTYDVQIRAVNSAGSGAASGTTQETPLAPAVPTITLSKASLAAKSVTYGTPSATETFTVSGVTLTGDNLTVSAPTGFEVSTDGTRFSSSVNLTISNGVVAETTIYARLAATAAVTGSYNSQNISIAGGGATTQNLATAATGNSVTAKTLTITGLISSSANKTYDGTTTANVTGTAVYTGLANGESYGVLDSVTWAFGDALVGSAKALVTTGTYTAPTTNYSIPSQPILTADITQATAPALTAASGATVDNSFEVTFSETSSLWRSSITSVTVGGSTLSQAAYSTGTSGKIVFDPALSALLQSSGSKSIVVVATGHSNGTVTQSIGAGTAVKLSIVTQPTAPASNGAALAAQPVVRLLDLYNNVTTSTANVTAAATQGTWTLGGTTTVAAVSGAATFSGLTATSAAGVTGATITFSSGSLSSLASSAFNLLAPPATNDTTGTAVALTVGAASTNGTFVGSTPSFSPTSTLNDVWYKFVATSTSHTLTVAGGSADMDPDIRVYEGTGASFNTAPTAYTTPTPLVIGQLAGVAEETVIATNFVVGRTYFVMVQEDGTAPGGSFTVQVRAAASSIATWNPSWSGIATSPLAATSNATNLSSGALARVGLTGVSSTARYNSSGWNSSSNYLTVTLTAATGYRLDLNDQILYGNWGISGNTGPGWFEVRSSVDSYASIIGYFDVSTSSQLLGAIKLPSSGFSGLSSVTFRIISSTTQFSGTGAVASTATGGPSALRVTGTLVQIPVVTPATVAGTVGTSLSYSISATGTPASYAIGSGTLPAGLSLNTTTGAITGTPSAAATGTVVSVTASNSAGTSSAANLTFNIAKGAPSITVAPTASAITYGQTLASSELTTGTASVAGTFAFTTLSTAPNAGSANQSVTFSPADTTNYNSASTTVSVTVNQKALTGSFTASNKAYDGSTAAVVASRSLSGVVGSDVVSLTGGTATFDTSSLGNGKTVTLTGAALSGAAAANYSLSSVSTTTANITVATLDPTSLTFSGGVVTVSNGVSGFSYSYVGRDGTTYSTSATAPTAPGLYKVTATSTDSNYTGSAENSYFIAGVIVGADSLTKPADHSAISIRVSELLANDSRITSVGAASTSGLTITGVTAGTGNSVVLGTGADAGWIFFTPSSAASDTFTYAVSDGTNSGNGTVTLTAEASLPPITLQLVKKGTAAFDGTTTRVSHDFIGVPGQTYQIEYSTDLTTWSSAGSVSTGATGSFSVNFSRAGDHAADWNAHQFFRAKR
ncbi:MAG: YDG domain-containing protein [Akkermansiaceae bacterium]|nr:YDG domain-containing protein [Akkermansiaceae bacterium]